MLLLDDVIPLSTTTPAQRPGPVTLQGRYGRVEKLSAGHAADLWKVFGGHDEVWTYISTDGPFQTEDAFSAFIAKRAAAYERRLNAARNTPM